MWLYNYILHVNVFHISHFRPSPTTHAVHAILYILYILYIYCIHLALFYTTGCGEPQPTRPESQRNLHNYNYNNNTIDLIHRTDRHRWMDWTKETTMKMMPTPNHIITFNSHTAYYNYYDVFTHSPIPVPTFSLMHPPSPLAQPLHFHLHLHPAHLHTQNIA